MERRHWARVYLEGLLLDGDRKSIEPIANRIPGADVQSLRQFVGQSPWSVDEIQKRLALKMIDLLSEAEVWIIDETSFPKAGRHSVGVARQYCGALGKIANCQVSVTLHWSSGEASCPLGWKLYLPRAWFEDPDRAAKAKVPSEIEYRSKSELAVELLDQMISWDVPARPVVADSAYGNEFAFREKLRKRGLSYAVQVEPMTVVWNQDPNIEVPPPKKTGRPAKYPPLASLPPSAKLVRGGPKPRRRGVAGRHVAARNSGSPKFPFRLGSSLGGARLAQANASRTHSRVAFGGMARRGKRSY